MILSPTDSEKVTKLSYHSVGPTNSGSMLALYSRLYRQTDFRQLMNIVGLES